jgi:hypothetical protein
MLIFTLNLNNLLMKSFFCTLALILTIHVNFAQSVEASKDFDADAPVFQFETELIDYGKIEKNSDGNRAFVFTNTGKSALVIETVKGSCGCTVPTKPEEPVLPGEKASIKVKYATNRVGRFSKTVTITSNASEPKKVLRIKGEVLAPKEASKKTE